MRHRLIIATLTGAATLALASSAFADARECRAATDSFYTHRADVFNAMQSYGHCVSANNGRDECSDQFSALESAHSRFESAVSNYGSDCESD